MAGYGLSPLSRQLAAVVGGTPRGSPGAMWRELSDPRIGRLVETFEALYEEGRFREALGTATEAVEHGRETVRAADDPADAFRARIDLGVSLINLADVRRVLGEFGTAEDLFYEAIDVLEEAAGDDWDLHVAEAKGRLALLLLDLGDYEGASDLLRTALTIFSEELDEWSVEVAVAKQNLGLVALERGDLGWADRLLRQAREILESKLGDHSLEVASRVLATSRL